MVNRLVKIVCLSLGIHFAMPTVVGAQSTPSPGDSSASSTKVLSASEISGSLSVDDKHIVVIDLGSQSSINLSGNLTNAGSIYAISTNPAVTSGTISAANIVNFAGGTISTVLPSGGIPGISNALANFNLVLNAVGSLTNSGTISGANNITAIAGSAITNYGVMQAAGSLTAIAPNIQNLTGVAGFNPIMQALGNLNITTANLVNQGVLASANANINVAATIASNLQVNNTAGVMQALNGAINFGTSDLVGKIDTTIGGGDFLSRELNIYSGCGLASLDGDKITGSLNIFAGEARVNAATPVLSLGNIHLSGDPTFFNKIGDIVINTDLVFPGAALALVAQGSIVTTAGAGKIDTSSPGGNGGEITLIAGANFVTTGACCVKPGQAGDTISTLTILGGSVIGGNIDLKSGTAITSLTSQSTGGNGDGGKITLVAFGNQAGLAGYGSITLPDTVTITSGGSGTGKNGDVTIWSAAPSGTGTNIGGINAAGGSGTSANVLLSTGTPTLSGGPTSCTPCLTIQNGAIIAGSFDSTGFSAGAGAIFVNGSIIANGTGTADGGKIAIYTSNTTPFVLGSGATTSGVHGVLSARGGSVAGSGGEVYLYTAAPLTMGAAGDVDVAPFNGKGGTITLEAESLTAPGGTILNGRAAGVGDFDGGHLALYFSTAYTTGGALIADASAAGGGNGGLVDLVQPVIGTGNNQLTIIANGGTPGSATGDGGRVTLGTFFGGSVVIDPAGLDLRPIGLNGKGASITGYLSSTTVKVNGSLDVSGVGSGDGGEIVINLSSNNTGVFAIGSSAAQGITGGATANAGITGAHGGTINIVTASSLTLASGGNVSVSAANGSAGKIMLQTSLAMTLPSGGIALDGGAGNTNGGDLSLIANTLTFSGPLAISSKAGGGGNGGSVTMQSSSGALTIAPGQLSFDMSGGSPGSGSGNAGGVTIQAGSFLVNPAGVKIRPLGINGGGGKLDLAAQGNIVVTSALDVSGVGFGDGGTVRLLTGSTYGGAGTSMVIGAASANGVNGDIIANAGPSGGSGGTIQLGANNTGSNVTVIAASNLQFATTQGNGGHLKIDGAYDSKIFIPAGKYDANAVGPGNYNGGSIDFGTLSPVSLDLTACATGSGDGGFIRVPQSIGFGANMAIVHATGGSAGSASGKGGHLQLSAPVGPGLIIDPTALDLRPLGTNGDGATIEVYDYGSSLQILGPVSADGVGTGSGGTVNLLANTGNFRIGSAAVSGVAGAVTANAGLSGGNGGEVRFNTYGGNLIVDNPNLISATGVKGGQIYVYGSGSVNFSAGGILSAAGTKDGGYVGVLVSGGMTSAGNVRMVVDGNGTGNGGYVYIELGGGGLSLGNGPGQFFLSANGGAVSGNAGGVNVNVAGALNLAAGGFSAQVLGTDGNGGQLSFISTGAITLPAVVSADGKGTGNGGLLAIMYSSAGQYTISGKISADATGTGLPGMIAIQNTASTLDLRITGTISAVSASGAKGQVVLNSVTNSEAFFEPGWVDPTKAVTLSGNGAINAEIIAGGSTFTANMSTPLTIALIRTTGDVNITAPSVSVVRYPGAIGPPLGPFYTGWFGFDWGGWTGFFGTAALWSNLPASAAIFTDANITINAPSIYNFGAITSNSNGNVTLTNPGVLNVGGTGLYSTNGGALTISGSSVNLIDSAGFAAGTGTVNLTAGAGGNITSANCTIQTVLTANALNITTSKLDFSGGLNLTNLASNSPVNFIAAAAGDLNITVDANLPPIVRTNGGGINLQSAPGFNINFTTGGAGPAALTFIGGPVTFTNTGGTVNVGNNVTVTTDNNLTFSLNNSSLINNGSLISTGGTFGGFVNVNSAGTATVSGAGSINAGIASGSGRINIQANAALTIGGTLTLNTGPNGGIAITGGSVAFSPAANLTVAAVNLVSVDAPFISFGAGSQFTSLQGVGQGLFLEAAGTPLVVTLPGSASGTIATAGGGVTIRTIAAGNAIQFASNGVPGTARLNVVGAAATTIGQANNIQVDAGVSLFTDSPLVVSPNASLVNNGTITGGGAAPDVQISSQGTLTVSGTGVIATASPGNIKLTAMVNNDLTFTGSQSFNPGAGGVTTLVSGGRAINLGAGVTETFLAGSTANLQTASINLGDGSAVLATSPLTNIVLTANQVSGLALVPGGPLTLTLPSNGSSTVATAGGSIGINSFQSLTVNTSGAGPSTLFLNGGSVSISGPTAVIQSGANISSDNGLSLNFAAGGFTVNSDLSAGGTLSVTAAGAITRAAGTLTGTTVSLSASGGANIGAGGQEILTTAGVLTLSTTGAAYINETNSVDLSGGSIGSLVLNTANGGSIGVAGNFTTAGSLVLNSNGAGAITDAGGYTLAANSLILTSGGGDLGLANAPIVVSSPSLSVSTTGSVYISQTVSPVSLVASSAGAFSLTSPVDVTVNGVLTLGSMNINATGAAGVTVAADINVTNQASLTTGTGGLTVNSGSVLQSSAGNVQITSSQVSTNGTISTGAAAGRVSFNTAGATLTLSGTGTISATGGGASVVTASAQTINLSGALTIDSGAAGTVSLTGSSSINQGAVVTVGGGSALNLSTPLLAFAAGAGLVASGPSTVTVQSPTGLQITTPDGGTGSISSNGGSISINATAGVTVNKTAGGLNGTLSLAGSAVSVTPGNGSMTVAANTILSNSGDQTLNVTSLANDGTIDTTGTLTVQSANSIVVSGTGRISGGVASVLSANGAVTVNQGSIGAVVSGGSRNNFSVTAGGADLTAGSINSSTGAVRLTNSTGTLTIQDTSTISAATDVLLTGGSGLSVGTAQGGVDISAGQVDPMVNAYSTNMADYDVSAITSPGRILLSTNSGAINLAQNASLTTFGGSLGMTSTGDINVGTGSQLFAQGGNIWLNGLGNINVASGTSFSAVARSIPAGAPVFMPVANLSIGAYQGGSIALDVDSLQANYDTYLRTNWEQQRAAAGGVISSGGGIDTTGSSMNYSNGGMVALVTSNPNKVAGTFLNVINSTLNSNGGVIYIDPPGSQVNLGNVAFQAFGPQLVAVPPGPVVIPPVAPGPGVAPVVIVPGAPAPLVPLLVADTTRDALQGQNARIVPLDTLDLNVPLNTPATREHQCVPSPLAQFAESAGEDGGWAVASGYCESFTVEGTNGSSIVSAGGTQISPSDGNSLRMRQGKMLAMAGKSGLTVTTGDARVTVAGESAMIIEESSKGVLRITQMVGAPGSIEIGRHGVKETITTQVGHEILVSVGDPEQEELIGVDGIDRVPIGATMKVADLQIRRSQVNPKQLLERSNLINCSTSGCFPARLRTKLNRLKEQAGVPRKAPFVSWNHHQELQHPYKSVGFVQAAVPPVSPLSTMTSSAGVIKHDEDARFSMIRPGAIVLRKGEILLAPERTTVVSSGTARVEVSPGAIALVARDGACLKVRGLWESSTGKIVARGGAGFVPVRAGQEVVVAASTSEMTAFLKGDSMARRRIVRFPTSTGEALMVSEVSFLGTVNDSTLLPALLKSMNPEDKGLRDRIVKMAVVLSVVTSRHGNFTPIKPNN